MRNAILIFSIFSLGTHAFSSSEDQTIPFSLDDAKKYAISNNNEVISFRHATEEARARSARARVPFFPNIGVAMGVNSLSSSQTHESAPLAYIYGSYNIFNGYKDSYQKQISEIETEKTEIILKQKELLAGLEVEKHFHSYLYQKTAIELKKSAIDLNNNLESIASQRRKAGLGSEADIMEFKLRSSILSADLVLLEQKKEEARIGLRKTLGHDIGSKIEPMGQLQHQHLRGDLMSYLNRLQNQNPILRVASHELAIADFQSQTWRSKWLPKVDFEARAGYQELDLRPTDKGTGISLLLVAKMDLFSGQEATWEKREGLARKLKAEEDLKGKLVNLVSELETFFRRLKAIETSVDLEEKNEVRAQKYYSTVLKEYNSGIKNSQDVKVAAEMLSEVNLRRLRYKYDFLTERLEMEKLLGMQVDIENIQDKNGHMEEL